LDHHRGALAQRDHRDDARDADHDAQHRQPGPYLVAEHRLHGQAERRGEIHAASWIRPSWIRIVRCACFAISWLCVTRMTVIPSLWRSWKSAITSASDLLSRFPVGSSARRM